MENRWGIHCWRAGKKEKKDLDLNNEGYGVLEAGLAEGQNICGIVAIIGSDFKKLHTYIWQLLDMHGI